MKKVITFVPKDKDLLAFIEEMGERAHNSWIFLHKNILENLSHSADHSSELDDKKCFFWDQSPVRDLACSEGTVWSKLTDIVDNRTRRTKGSAFVWFNPEDPEEIIFLKMEE